MDMDAVTQMLFGATVAQVGFRRQLGRKAIAAGAVLALIPDLDVAIGLLGDPLTNWVHHRSLTHSVLFGPLVGPLIGYGLWCLDRKARPSLPSSTSRDGLRAWIWLSILAVLTHPLIDLFTSYGTQLLWPFTNMRFAIDAMPIVDPLYSGVLVAAIAVGLSKRASPSLAQDSAAAALLFIGIYTLGGWAINEHIRQVARKDFDGTVAVSAYPLPLQPYYRRVVAVTPSVAHVGYYSILNPAPIKWQSYSNSASDAATAVRATKEAGLLNWFAMGKTLWRDAPDGRGGTIVEGTDLRYGMPGTSDQGLWGIRVNVSAAMVPAADVEIFTMSIGLTRDALTRYWSDLTGWGRPTVAGNSAS
jgi:inner membrane protein